MADRKNTVWQNLEHLFGGNTVQKTDYTPRVNRYGIDDPSIIYRTKSKESYELKKLEMSQQKLLQSQWVRANYNMSTQSIAGLTDVKLMYRDVDLMDGFPEIGAALDIQTEEATYVPTGKFMVNVNSSSERIKSVLRDLLDNRLSINMTLPMVTRSTCKYGNTFMLLNLDSENGVVGWTMLPVYEIERYENGMENPYAQAYMPVNMLNSDVDDSVKFVWVGQAESTPYRSWQIAHFRLLYDSLYLPYGVSSLNKARRHWRMLSMMEDMMLLYRLERSVERRVFKINVGAIDEQDVKAYVQSVADEFKRTPIIDPATGQIDLRKNIMSQMDDYFIPVRDDNAGNPIDTLQGAQNLTAMDDIKYVQNKVCTALRVPKSFLNFEEEAGEGKNLSLLDVRFQRTVNRIQQTMIMELNKICILHLYLLGFRDDLTNFTLSMNNPSSQAEMLELDNMAKKITTAKDAITDNGNGIPLMSVTRAWKTIMGWSEQEIEENLEELRLEKALANELAKTGDIIQKTGLFDTVDNIYGTPGAEYSKGNGEEGGPGGGPGGGGGMPGGLGMPGGGGEIDFGDSDEAEGAEGEMDMGDAAQEDETIANGPEGGDMGGGMPGAPEGGAEPLAEAYMRRKLKKIEEDRDRIRKEISGRSEHYSNLLKERREKARLEEIEKFKQTPILNKALFVNEQMNEMIKSLDNKLNSMSEGDDINETERIDLQETKKEITEE